MICAVLLDCDDSKDFPGGTASALGRPIAAYPFLAAKAAARLDRIYAVTESPAVRAAALQYGAHPIDPPPAKGPDRRTELLAHGWRAIAAELAAERASASLLVVLSAASPAVAREAIEAGLEALRGRPELDSAVTVVPGERWHPSQALRLGGGGLLETWKAEAAPPEAWYPDWAACVIRPRNLEAGGGPPFAPWLGRRVLPLKQWAGGPVDHAWQIPCLEYWLRKQGVPDLSPSLAPKPQPQPAPKGERR